MGRGGVWKIGQGAPSRMLKNSPFTLRQAAMWMSSDRASSPLMFLRSPTEERLAAMRGTAQWPSHCVKMRPSLRHNAPGSLSQWPNLQDVGSCGSACRRVVPWGTVSSLVKGAE